ncbi:MAG: maleylpyruvate isomerase N-terminal domain-containing protein [Acidimicrobiia bacterium]|nr:maleylpyruvate isomerase N-terminal domain-containing protein [Acidimicrobiia bacterium]
MRGSSDHEVVDLYASGVVAVVESAASWESADWARPACGEWDRGDTVRHLCAVVSWYHSWLDRALAGDSSPPFHPDEFEPRNQAGVEERKGLTGPEAVIEFEQAAGFYLDRAQDHWGVAFGFPLGSVTVGEHVGVAAAEWHLHAWDLTSTDAQPHSPVDPQALFRAAGFAMAAAQGGARGRLTKLMVPGAARVSPWQQMLKRSGRRPQSQGKN